MFRKGRLDDPQLEAVWNAASKLEADQAKEILEKAGIPALLIDREDSGDYLRVLGFGSPFGVDVYVNRSCADQARQIIGEAFSQAEDISEEELAELAENTPAEE